MLVTLIGEEKIFSIHLPEKISGKYWMLDDEKDMNSNRILAIEADDGGEKWVVRADRQLKLFDEKQVETKHLELEEGELYRVAFGRNAQTAYLLAEAFTEDRGVYKKYTAARDVVLSIGRESDNNIIISNPYVSARHGSLSFADGTWMLCDNNSTNGTYVNRHRVQGQTALKAGDVVFILGFKFVVGSNFISMNNPDQSVRINTDILLEFSRKEYVDDETMELEPPSYYYRSPRFVREITPLELQVDSPTRREDGEITPLLLTLGPSLIMGVASFSVGIFSIVNTAKGGGVR